jgi:hypothetical protein
MYCMRTNEPTTMNGMLLMAKSKSGRYRKHVGGHTQRVNLTLDPEVYADAAEILYGSGKSVSEVVNELLKLHVVGKAKDKGQGGQ